MSEDLNTTVREAFFALHHGLPRQGPGSDATTRRLLELAGPLPEQPRTLDLGCGPGRSALLLAPSSIAPTPSRCARIVSPTWAAVSATSPSARAASPSA